MSKNQQAHIEQTWPFAKGKVFRLGHWQNKNVPDPYQHDQAFLMRHVSLFNSVSLIGKIIFNF
jgi:protein-tyrosine phosphatase